MIGKIFGSRLFINLLILVSFFGISSGFLYFVLGVPLYLIWSLGISGVLIFIFGRFKGMFTIYLTILFVMFNFGLLVFALIPTYDKQIDMKPFYNQMSNYVQIDINDEQETLEENNVSIIIQNNFEKTQTRYRLNELEIERKQIMLKQDSGYSIIFISKSKKIKSKVNIHLWDGSIIRIHPQSTIKLNNIAKNQKDIISSKTDIEVAKGSIWFHVIRTINSDEGFNIKTSNGTIVIRGTAGLVNFDTDTLKSTLYSHDHIIEVNNGTQDIFISKGSSAEFDNTKINEIDNSYISSMIEGTVDKVQDFGDLDKLDIDEYKSKLQDYIQENFNRKLDKINSFDYLSMMKLKLMSKYDPKYQEAYKNYQKYKILAGEKIENTNYEELFKDTIITPLNETTQNLKLKYLQSLDDVQAKKSYTINTLNKSLDLGNSIDINSLGNYIKSGTDKIYEQFNK